MFDRFVDFVGIEFEQMKMGFVLLAERFDWNSNIINIRFYVIGQGFSESKAFLK